MKITTWDRAAIHGAIEEATGQPLSVGDTTADTLLTRAQAIGLQPHELRLWIYDQPRQHNFEPEALERWAARVGFGHAPAELEPITYHPMLVCPGCGQLTDPAEHICPGGEE